MSLNIKNEHTVAKVREYALRTHQSQTSAVDLAVTQALAGINSNEIALRRRERTTSTLAEIRRLIGNDATFRARMDAELYDDAGLPR